jgi:hypothetical protein
MLPEVLDELEALVLDELVLLDEELLDEELDDELLDVDELPPHPIRLNSAIHRLAVLTKSALRLRIMHDISKTFR